MIYDFNVIYSISNKVTFKKSFIRGIFFLYGNIVGRSLLNDWREIIKRLNVLLTIMKGMV